MKLTAQESHILTTYFYNELEQLGEVINMDNPIHAKFAKSCLECFYDLQKRGATFTGFRPLDSVQSILLEINEAVGDPEATPATLGKLAHKLSEHGLFIPNIMRVLSTVKELNRIGL